MAGFIALVVFGGMVWRTRECYRLPNENVLPPWAGIILFPLWPSFVTIDFIGDRLSAISSRRIPLVFRTLVTTMLFSMVWIPILLSINADINAVLVTMVVIGAGAVSSVLRERTRGDWYLIPAMSLLPWMRF